jgi:hypothetical protein
MQVLVDVVTWFASLPVAVVPSWHVAQLVEAVKVL